MTTDLIIVIWIIELIYIWHNKTVFLLPMNRFILKRLKIQFEINVSFEWNNDKNENVAIDS